MKAMIFAAGLGTRLKPFTNEKPKALVEINGIPLLEIAINRLKLFGFNQVIVNVHHFAEQVIDFLKRKNNFNIDIAVSDESDLLLDTGGGLLKAAWFFNDNKPFLVHNADILSDINLLELYNSHAADSLATLAVMKRESSRYFLFNENNRLCGWENRSTGEKIIKIDATENLKSLAFSGIHILSPKIFESIQEKGVFSITQTYLNLCAENTIGAFIHNNSFWMDMGKPENIMKAELVYKM